MACNKQQKDVCADTSHNPFRRRRKLREEKVKKPRCVKKAGTELAPLHTLLMFIVELKKKPKKSRRRTTPLWLDN